MAVIPGIAIYVPGNGMLPLGMLLSKMKPLILDGTFTMELDPQR